MEKKRVVVEVKGGVAEVTEQPSDVEVIIRDWDNINAHIIELYATVDEEGMYLDITDTRREAEEFEQKDPRAVGVIKGYGVIDYEGKMPDNASDFHYKFEDAVEEVEELVINVLS